MAQLTLFEKLEDYDSFTHVFDEHLKMVPLPILAMVLMPNHRHFVMRQADDHQVSEFFRRLSVVHTLRYHSHYETSGTGHLYQGRFKSFPIQDDDHLWMAMRYVAQNPIRANFVERAEDWAWSSPRMHHQPRHNRRWLTTPVDPPLPREWSSWVNNPEPEAELTALRNCNRRGLTFGNDDWVKNSAIRLGLESTMRRRGRRKKESRPI